MMGMKAEQVILTRLLPKTGQSTVYQAGDDGTYQAGWWEGKTVADNKTRFVAKTIGGDDVVIDLATGLMWAADGLEAGCWNGGVEEWDNSIVYAEALTFAGFSNWRMPNIRELMSIIDYSLKEPSIAEPPFSNTELDIYWSSTTNINSTVYAWVGIFAYGSMNIMPKTNSNYLRCVRSL